MKNKRDFRKATKSLLVMSGFEVADADSYNAKIKIAKDMFGFGDLLAFCVVPPQIVMIQYTSKEHMRERFKKITKKLVARKWIEMGARIWVVGWDKEMRPLIWNVYLEDFK